MDMEKAFRCESWFEELFGFSESLENVTKNIIVTEFPDHVELTSRANNKTFNAGYFSVRSCSSFVIGEGKGELKKRGNGKLHIIHGHGFGTPKIEMVDALDCQSQPEWNGATFQAASNFNCLEFVSSSQTAANGIKRYIYDQTQGPYAALAAGPAIMLRNYFIKHDDAVGQVNVPLNLLKRTPIHVTNGYPFIFDDEAKGLEKSDFDWDNPENWPVGVHRNCEVTMKRSPYGFATAPPNQIVHQIYAAAFNFSGTVIQTPFTMKIGIKMLSAEYRATVLAAWENSQLFPGRPGSNRLVLTLLGGGVFGNPPTMICQAISSCMDVIVDSGLDVYVCCYSNHDFETTYPLLEKHVKETGGNVIDTV